MKKEVSSYHPELISLYIAGVPAGIVIGNTFVPLLFIYAMQEYIPVKILIFFLIYSIFVSLVRIIVTKKLKKTNNDSVTREIYIKYSIISAAFSGAIWGISVVLVYLYAPVENIFFVTTMIFGLISASITTLTPLFKAFITYILFAILPLMVIFLLIGGHIYNSFAVLTIFFTIFVVLGGYKHYKKLRESIILKDQLKELNNDLESEVKIRTMELEELNNSLEDKVANEIEKNRDKDQKMLQQSRMAQMGEMISMIAHQWRQPLGAIASTSIDLRMKMMLDSYDLDDKEQQNKCKEYLNGQLVNIEEYVQNLTQTIDDFRNFYKPDKRQKSQTVNEPVKKSLNIIKATIDANGIKIIESYKSETKLLMFDSELMQVFLNILKNAQDNFKEKGTSQARITIETIDIKNGVKVEICDNGGGIDESIMEKIFDPYFSTKSEKNGTGLGLYMSKTIIQEHHNGKLSVENRDGGVCFIIELIKK